MCRILGITLTYSSEALNYFEQNLGTTLTYSGEALNYYEPKLGTTLTYSSDLSFQINMQYKGNYSNINY